MNLIRLLTISICLCTFQSSPQASDSVSSQRVNAFLFIHQEGASVEQVYSNASLAIRESTSSEVLDAALTSLWNYANLTREYSNVVAEIDEFLNRNDTTQFGNAKFRATLIKGGALIAMGNPEEVSALFENEVLCPNQDRWEKCVFTDSWVDPSERILDALEFYTDALTDSGDYLQAIEEVYKAFSIQRVIEPQVQTAFRLLYKNLVVLRDANEGHDDALSVTDQVMPRISRIEPERYKLEMMKVLCLLADRQYPSAAQLLWKLKLEPTTGETSLILLGDVNLFLFATYCLEGNHLDLADEAWQDFVELNRDRPEFILRESLAVADAIEKEFGFQRILGVTTLLIENGYDKEDKYAGNLSTDYWIEHLLDIHAQGLYAQRNFVESRQLFERLVEKSFPSSPAGVNAMFCLARLEERENNLDTAAIHYSRVAQETLVPYLVFRARQELLEIWLKDPNVPNGRIAQLVADLKPQAVRYGFTGRYYDQLIEKLNNGQRP